jgi:serine/threonine-protein kinase HipA
MRKMRTGIVKYNNEIAGILTEEDHGEYVFAYYEI